MSSTLATLAAALLPFVPSPQDPDKPTVLDASAVRSLNKEAKAWFTAWQKYEYDSPRPSDRRKNGARLQKARDKFMRTWKSKSKKGDPLTSVDEVKAVFENSFDYPRQSTSGIIKPIKGTADVPAYSIVAPRKYRQTIAHRGIVLLPGFDDAKKSWDDSQVHFAGTWNGSSVADDSIFIIPTLDDGIDLDTDPDFSKPTAEQDENARLTAVFVPFGQVQRDFNLDRDRQILDCGRGSSRFGLRIASYFPSRFAGLILRWPTQSDSLRLGTLRGTPILLVANDETKAAAEALQKQLNGDGQDGPCKILEGKGDYPFVQSQAEIAAWVTDVKRDLWPSKVVLELNSDRFKSGFWVQVGTAEPLDSVPKDERPRIEAVADRAANQITVTARNISDFRLLLNDEIVDLSEPFTVVVNGEAVKEQRQRSMDFMIENMQGQFDPTFVFTSYFDGSVPKSDGD